MKSGKNGILKTAIGFIVILIVLTIIPAVGPVLGQEQEPQIDWVVGPTEPVMGNNLAVIKVGEDLLYTGAEGAVKAMEITGNQPSQKEIGLVTSGVEGENWFVIFEYDDIGYISDEDKDDIDADAILDSYKKGTEEANKYRAEQGIPALHVTGWYQEPYYDDQTNNLVWAMIAKSEGGGESVNYNVRLLGRSGYVSALLVTNPDELDTFKPKLDELIAGFSYVDGKKYADFTSGDKVAKIGLAALVAGGAGAAAVKFGLFKFLAKAWKLVAVVVLAFFGAIGGFLKKLFGRKKENEYMTESVVDNSSGDMGDGFGNDEDKTT